MRSVLVFFFGGIHSVHGGEKGRVSERRSMRSPAGRQAGSPTCLLHWLTEQNSCKSLFQEREDQSPNHTYTHTDRRKRSRSLQAQKEAGPSPKISFLARILTERDLAISSSPKRRKTEVHDCRPPWGVSNGLWWLSTRASQAGPWHSCLGRGNNVASSSWRNS